MSSSSSAGTAAVLDNWINGHTHKWLAGCARRLSEYTTPDTVTLTGFGLGLMALPLLVQQQYLAALVAILANRLADGLDGAMARHTGVTDAGGFLDITLDFIFYAAVVLGFAAARPEANAVAAAFLLFCFMGTASSFLAFAIMAAKRPQLSGPCHKSLHYLEGLTEGTETLLFFVVICLWPALFPAAAVLFGGLCLVTTGTRVYRGYHQLQDRC